MARTLIEGWEKGSLTALNCAAGTNTTYSVGTTGAGVSIDVANQRTGRGCLKIAAVSGSSNYWGYIVGGLNATVSGRLRVYVKVTARPASLARTLIGAAPTTAVTVIKLNASGTLNLNVNNVSQGNSAVALTDTTKWYNIEVRTVSGAQELFIDGVSQVVSAVAGANPVNISMGSQESIADTFTAYFDDLVCDNADTIIGDSKVALLVPNGDTFSGGQWTGGGGGISLFQGIYNLPPTGSATATDANEIKSASNVAGTSSNEYEPQMQLYTDVGITRADTIKTIIPVADIGEAVATGTKTGTFGCNTNPTGALFTISEFAPTSGAQGTYPTGWWAVAGAAINLPSVNVAFNPSMLIRKTDLTTRVASCCFMGMWVEYIPSTVTQAFIAANKIPQLVSLQRAAVR